MGPRKSTVLQAERKNGHTMVASIVSWPPTAADSTPARLQWPHSPNRFLQRDARDCPLWLLPFLMLRYWNQTTRESEQVLLEKGRDIPKRKGLILVNSRDDSFECLNEYQKEIAIDFHRIVSARYVKDIESLPAFSIGINIRLGNDFKPPAPPESPSDGYKWVGWLQQTPLSWFIETLALVRDCAGWCVPAVVVSDGTAQQLSPLLKLPSVHHLYPSNAVIDLIVLSRSKLLLGSGSSTFSAWAAFIGQQPVFTAPGHPFTRLKLEPQSGQMIASFDPRLPEPKALIAMVEAVGRRP